MGYRKLTVDGKEYEYVVGKTHTKVKGIKTVFLNEDIGIKCANSCDCCGEPLDQIYSDECLSEHDFTYRVIPENVASAIRSMSLYKLYTISDLFEKFNMTHYTLEKSRNALRKEVRKQLDSGKIKLDASMKMIIFEDLYNKLEKKFKEVA